ncbi:MAG: uncharacterized protein QOI29_3748, partial [Mycobacterium sp.]|nr:uncharacterized protein [Mycobacterium sp.]
MERIHPYERSVAVIGSGVSGLVAAHALSARDRVTLFEADTRIGGHAHTHYVDRGDGYIVGIDSAFLVHNDRTYPTLCRLFDDLGIATQETDMSMSVRDDASGLEYAGARGIGGLFPSWSTLTRPRYLLMLAEIKRFHAAATRLLQTDADNDTLGAFVDRHGFSRYFVDHFMTPLVAAVWSCPPGEALRYPARYLFVFLEHHGMLSVFGSPAWRTVVGGSASYVEAILNRIDEVRAGVPVTSVRRVADGVAVTAGATRIFDAAVVAAHPDQALLMLAEPTATERAVLGAIPYCANHAQLHTDESVLPRRPRARASWNYLVTPNDDSVLVTYDVTRLMRLVAAAPRAVAQAFADEVRAVRETMAVVSAATAVEPPEALRDRLLTDVSTAPVVELRRKPWRTTILAAAAALVIGLGALGVGLALRPAPAP